MFRGILLWCLFAISIVCQGQRVDPTLPKAGLPDSKVIPMTSVEDQIKERYEITSILISNKRRQAYINGNMILEGDEFDGMRVVNISRRGVVMSKRGRTFTISLAGDSIKKAANKRSKE